MKVCQLLLLLRSLQGFTSFRRKGLPEDGAQLFRRLIPADRYQIDFGFKNLWFLAHTLLHLLSVYCVSTQISVSEDNVSPAVDTLALQDECKFVFGNQTWSVVINWGCATTLFVFFSLFIWIWSHNQTSALFFFFFKPQLTLSHAASVLSLKRGGVP